MAASRRTIMRSVLPLFIATCLLSGGAGVSIYTPQINKEPYKLGRNFTLNIRVDNPSNSSSISILKKPIVVKTRNWDNEKEYEVTKNGALVKQLQDTGRYTYTETNTSNEVRGTLSITGLTVEDVGFYSITADSLTVHALYPLQAYVPVKSVYFQDTKYYDRGPGKAKSRNDTAIDAITVRAGGGSGGITDTDLLCVVKVEGTTISPNVSFWIGQGADRINVTDKFDQEGKVSSHGGNGALSKLSSRIELAARSSQFIKPEHHDKKLFCEATMPDKHYPIKTANVTLNVEFKPGLKCPGKWMFKEGQKNAMVTCFIVANPKMDLAKVSWYSPADAANGLSNITLLHGEIEDGIRMENKVINSTFDETKLHFKEIKHSRTFTITARSNLGTLSASIYVKSGAGSLVLHTFVLVFTSILALATQWN